MSVTYDLVPTHGSWLVRRPRGVPDRVRRVERAALVAFGVLVLGFWASSHADWGVPPAVPSAVPAPDRLPPPPGTLMPAAGSAPSQPAR
jgi:hypothetical protein